MRTEPIVTAVLERAADEIKGKQQVRPFVAGPETWTAVYAAMHEMVAYPVVEHLRRYLRLDQVQHWHADRETAVKELRAAAGEPGLDLAALQNKDAHRQLSAARERMARALGYDGADHGYTLGQLCADVESALRQRDYRIADLEKRQETRS